MFDTSSTLFTLRWEEEGMAVGVDGHWDTVVNYQVIEETAVALEIFRRPEEGSKYLAGGVVDG